MSDSLPNKEIGIFLIWESAGDLLNSLIGRISQSFEIKKLILLHWEKSEVCGQLNKLYPHREFYPGDRKVKDIGTSRNGCALNVVVFNDSDPQHKDGVNTRVLQIKEEARSATGKNFLHCSDNEGEAFENLEVLISTTREEFEKYRHSPEMYYQIMGNDPKNLVVIETPATRFATLNDAFRTLDHQKWVILRNWEDLADEKLSEGHSDIDFLVENLPKAIEGLQAKKMAPQPYRVQYYISVSKKPIPVDLRYVGDGYMDVSWQRKILERRKKCGGFYIPSTEDHFWSLLYHAYFQKPYFGQDYQEKLKSIIPEMQLRSDLKFEDMRPCISFLKRYLKENNYQTRRPGDRSVYYRYSIRAYKRRFLDFLTNRAPVLASVVQRIIMPTKRQALAIARRLFGAFRHRYDVLKQRMLGHS